MALAAFNLFLPDVAVECLGVPDPVATNAIRNACFDFCARSQLWYEVQDEYTYAAGEAEHQITPPPQAQVVAVLSLNLGGATTLYPRTLEDLELYLPQWRAESGQPFTYYQPASDTVRLVCVPAESGTFTPTVAYAPTRSATGVERFIYDQHLETIKYGALAKLKRISGQPWSDPAGAAEYDLRFRSGVSAARVKRFKSNSRAELRVLPRPFV